MVLVAALRVSGGIWLVLICVADGKIGFSTAQGSGIGRCNMKAQ